MRLAWAGNYFGALSTKFVSLRQRAGDAWRPQNGCRIDAAGDWTKGSSIERFDNELFSHPPPSLLSIVARAVMGVSLSFATYSAVAVRENNAVEQDFLFRAS